MASSESDDEKFHDAKSGELSGHHQDAKSGELSGHHQDSSLESPKKKKVVTGESEMKPRIGVMNQDQCISSDISSSEESVSEEEMESKKKKLEEELKNIKKKMQKKSRRHQNSGPSGATSNAENITDNPNTAGPSGATSNAENVTDNPNTGSDFEEAEEIRIVLVGHTGNGKSATGNTIIGKKNGKDAFIARLSCSSITQVCQIEETRRDNKKIIVIDTPGLYPTNEKDNEKTLQEVRKCVGGCLPGPHAIIYVLQIGGKFTDEEVNTIKQIDSIFEKYYYDFVIFLFTNKDVLQKEMKTLDEFLADMPKYLKKILGRAKNRKIAFKNVNCDVAENENQLDELFTQIRQLGGKGKAKYYTDDKLKKIERELQKTGMTLDERRRDILRGGKSYNILKKWYHWCFSK